MSSRSGSPSPGGGGSLAPSGTRRRPRPASWRRRRCSPCCRRLFTVVNDVSFSRFTVDHVVVGPSAVWGVETKSHGGLVEEHADSVWLNGRPMYRDPRRQARGGAAALAELLERETGRRSWVEALVCFPNATVAANGHPAEACVVGKGQLLTRLRLAPTQLGSDERITRWATAARTTIGRYNCNEWLDRGGALHASRAASPSQRHAVDARRWRYVDR